MFKDNDKKPVSQSDESTHAQAITGLDLVNKAKGELSADDLKEIREYLMLRYGPAMRHNEMIKVLCIGRSTSFLLIKNDPTFPKGFSILDSANSPKIYLTHQVIAWLEARSNKCRNMKEGN